MRKRNVRMEPRAILMGLWLVLLALGLRLVGMTAAGAALGAVDARQFAVLARECLGVPRVRAETASDAVREPEKPPKTSASSDASGLAGTTSSGALDPAGTASSGAADPAGALPDRSGTAGTGSSHASGSDGGAMPEFTAQEAAAIGIGGSAEAEVDAAALLTAPLPLERTPGPLVLIVHTHTTEAYTPAPGAEYTPTAAYRTRDALQNVTRVGEALADELRARGIPTLHDTTIHDDPAYEGAYDRSYDTIAAQLAAHPSIQIVLDLHRDAMEDAEGNALARCCEIDGETSAQVMLVVGTDEGGLPHPDWRENLSFALKLQALLNREAPGLCRDLSLRRERFNQHFTPASLLVEVGASGNTLEQTFPAVRQLAQAIAELFPTR